MNERPFSTGRFGLRVKIILAMAAVLLAILVVVGVVVFAQVSGELKESMRLRGKGLVRNLRSESKMDLYYEQKKGQNARLVRQLAEEESVLYVLVLRKAKKGDVGIAGTNFVPFVQVFRQEGVPRTAEQLVRLHLDKPDEVIEEGKFLGFTETVFLEGGASEEASALAGDKPTANEGGEDVGENEALLLGDLPDDGEDAAGVGEHEKSPADEEKKVVAGGTRQHWGYILLGFSTARLDSQRSSLLLSVSVALFLALLVFTGLIYLSSNRLYQRLLVMMDAARRISKGDLAESIPEVVQDEIGMLADALNRISGNLNDMIGKIAGVTDGLGDAVENITASTEEVVRGAEYQVASVDETSSSVSQMLISLKGIAENVEVLASSAEESSSSILEMAATNDEVADNIHSLAASVEETTGSIEQMTSSIKEVAKSIEDLSTTTEQTSCSMREMDSSIGQVESNANETASLSEEVRRDAERGAEAVKKTMQGISRISDSTQTAFTVMEALGKKAQAIGQVLTVIDDVAEQTNLLALNAAIIAAQAGEHGKGFAVVADEIKDLAERTAASTSEISNLIRGVQSETKNVLEAMDRGLKSVDEGVTLSTEAEQALRKILESSTKSTRMVRAIARATVEQARGSKEVTSAISRIAETVQQIATATAQQAKGSEQIMNSAERMKIITQHVHASSQEQARGSKQITKAIENISEMVHHLNRAQKEQARGADQVMKAVERIKEVAEHHSDSMAKMKAIVDRVAEQAETLRKEMTRFKL